MTYLDDLGDRVAERPAGTPAALWGVIVSFWRALAEIAEAGRAARQDLNQIQARLLIVDELPVSAPFGALIRVRGTAPLYLGNGPNQPLSKIVPVPA